MALRALRSSASADTNWSITHVDMDTEASHAEGYAQASGFHAHNPSLLGSFIDKSRPVRLLEIGDFYGDSLQLWQESLHPDSTVTVVDIRVKLVKSAAAGQTFVSFGEQETASLLKAAATRYGPFDVIVDGGSSMTSDMMTCLRCLTGHALVKEGTYLAAGTLVDLMTFYGHNSFAGILKTLYDSLFGHYRLLNRNDHFRGGQALLIRPMPSSP